MAVSLTRLGLESEPYHAGLPPETRVRVQDDWTQGRVPVICATISFGMGVDKENVRFVAHWTIPKSLAGYLQESGRAGRDNKPANCRIYYSRLAGVILWNLTFWCHMTNLTREIFAENCYILVLRLKDKNPQYRHSGVILHQ
jgi:ATP-dependent helicase YprA (DUF1998 family)